MKQKEFDERYIRMAFIWSENSYAIRRKVGCLIVKDNSIISDGYNGTPSGFENVCETVKCTKTNENLICDKDCSRCACSELETKPYVLHAESNAIAKLAKSSQSSQGATLYVTDEPCLDCAKLIIQAGIKRVVYSIPYRLHQGLELLNRANIEVKQILLTD